MIAAVILTRNEERHIGACLETLDWVDRRVVFDNYSEDETLAIARAAGADVIDHKFVDFASQRNAALEEVESDWIFFVDADERASRPMGREIGAALAAASERTAGFYVPRENYLFGKLTRGGGYWPDYQMRLLRRGRARYRGAASETVTLDGEASYLKSPLIHYNYDSLEHFHRKQIAREELEALNIYRTGVRPKPYTPYTMTARTFWRHFVTLQGYRDGFHGLRLSALLAYYFGYRYYRRAGEMFREETR